MRANAGWKRWVAWEAVQIVARSGRPSAAPHEGPRPPRLATVSSRTTGVARTASKRVAWSGRPEPDDHSAPRSRAARQAFHSRPPPPPPGGGRVRRRARGEGGGPQGRRPDAAPVKLAGKGRVVDVDVATRH